MIVYTAAAALLIALVYILFLRRMDLFEQERPLYTFLAFLMGCVFLFLVFGFQAIIPLKSYFSENGSLYDRFMFHFVAVALFEEFVKILPFLILLPFRKIVNEPFDFIKYSSIGALGFATIENMFYFHRYSLEIAETRAFYTAVMHMFTSSIIGYFMLRSRYVGCRHALFGFIPGFILAMAVHAAYNTCMSTNSTYFIGIGLTIAMLVVWGRMMNNALNQSPFYTDALAEKVTTAGLSLVLGWASIFVFVAFAISITQTVESAWTFVREGILFGVFSGIGLYLALGKPKLKKGHWRSLFRR